MAVNEKSTIVKGHSEHDFRYGERLLPQVVDQKSKSNPDHVLGLVARSENISKGFSTITYAQIAQAVNFMSYWIDDIFPNGRKSEVICFIGTQDFRYWILEIAAIKTGHPLLIPNIRNATPNTISLLQDTKCTKLLYAAPLATQAKTLADASPERLETFEVPELDFMISQSTQHYSYSKSWNEAKYDTVVILHTSGSTGAPKPIRLNHIHFNRVDLDHIIKPLDGRLPANTTLMKRDKFVYMGLPFFHLSGVTFGTAAFLRDSTMIIGPPTATISGRIVCDIIKALPGIHGLIMVPALCDSIFIEHGQEMLPYLKDLFHVLWLGGPLAQSTGDFITTHTNAHLWQIFGSTEASLHPLFLPPAKHWNCLSIHPFGPSVEVVPGALTEDGSQLYELVQTRKKDSDPGRKFQPVFDIFPDLQQWRTRDLVTKVEIDGDTFYSFQGRLDDILVLSTGLKVNPVHLEMKLISHHALSGCLAFGSGHTRCGLLLEPRSDVIQAENLINVIWPEVIKANSALPEHARVSKHMMVVVKAGSFPRAGKGTVIRKQTYQMYEKEIKQTYCGA